MVTEQLRRWWLTRYTLNEIRELAGVYPHQTISHLASTSSNPKAGSNKSDTNAARGIIAIYLSQLITGDI